MLGWWRIPRALHALASHVHPDAYEICFLTHGHVDWWVEGAVHELRRGDLFVTRPQEAHGGVDAVIHPCELFWVQVVLSVRQPLPGLDTDESAALVHEFSALPFRSCPGSAALRPLFESLLAEHRRPGAHGALAARAALHALLVQVLRDQQAHAERLRGWAMLPSPPVRHALAWIESHLDEMHSAEEIAQAVGLSPAQLWQKFVEEVGLTPAEYRMHHRVGRAKLLLREGHASIGQIAVDLGFSTSQYFATVFKNLTGTTPGNYQRAARAGRTTEESRA